PRFGHIVADHPILAIDKVRYYGEPVALVVADSLAVAAHAASLVDVTYQDLPAAMDVAAAMSPGAPLIHERTPVAEGDGADNVAHRAALEWGDVDGVMAEAHLVVETRMHYPMLYAYAMEPYNALATFA